mgnify:FL=1
MKMVVLSRSRHIPSTKRIVDAAILRGHSVRVLNPINVAIHLDGQTSRLLYRTRRLPIPEVVVPRIAASIASYGLPILDQFVTHGALAMNGADSIGLSRNPARCLHRLAANGREIPSTIFSRGAADLKAMVARVGGVPVLVKLLAGSERRGVMVCESERSLEAALEAILGLGHNIVMQEYIRKAGRDIRVFVVGGEAIAAVSRIPKAGRLSRTRARFSRIEPCEMSLQIKAVSEQAARLCALEVCAIDLLEVKSGEPRVFEVNASPALPQMEVATGIDLAEKIVQRAEVMVAKPSTKMRKV